MPPTERRFWVVRAGSAGEDEKQVLGSGLAMLVFREAPFPIPSDKNAIREGISDANPSRNPREVGNWVGQLDTFANVIEEGDFVVLPRMRPLIAVGKVTGPYEHREIDGELRHTRRVQWIRKDIPRDSFGADVKFLDVPMTVFRIWNNNVTERIGGILDETELDLKSDEGLRRACEQAGAATLDPDRVRETAALLKEVQAASLETRATEQFQTRIWGNKSVWRGGTSGARVTSALDDSDFREWFAQQTVRSLASEGSERTKDLHNIYRETTDKLKEKGGRVPIIETLRALAICFPGDFTGVMREEKLFGLLRAMGMRGSEERLVEANRRIVDRLTEVMGPVDTSDLDAVAERMLLGGALYGLWRRPVPPEPIPTPVPRPDPVRAVPSLGEVMRRFRAAVKEEKLRFPEALVESLHLGLWADRQRHFAVLAGLSGTGKTQLAVQYGKALTGFEGETGGPVEVIAVQPGWHDPGRLLGYVNPLADGAYQRTEFLDFLLAASENPGTPHVLVLDEMNLSHPEQYFAPMLSAMERKGGEIALHRGDAEKLGVPTGIPYPENLVIIGTVNMDETTMGISDKVLDRAFTLEFWDIDPKEWPGWTGCSLGETEKSGIRQLLTELTDALRPAQRHFGWRVIAEAVGFLEQRTREADGKLDATAALDAVIYAKVLPKVRGDDTPRFRKCLEDTRKVLEGRNLEKCTRKVKELQEDLDATGSASFWRRP